MKRKLVTFAAPAPEWLKAVQADAKSKGLDTLTMREIDRLIAAARAEAQEHVGKPDRQARR